MPEIQIRSAQAADIEALIAIDHNYSTDYVWQMEVQQPDENEISVRFRQVRLPRSVRVEYPRSLQSLKTGWKKRSSLLMALTPENDEIVGYVSISKDLVPLTAWITDIAVIPRLRRRGIGAALILAAQEWAKKQHLTRIILEAQPKNDPAISLAQILGFGFCGYNDRYYANQDIALFFAKSIR